MVYIDSEFKCHTSNPDGRYMAVETGIFDGKCDAYIDGYRYIPAGQSWTRSDGEVFEGEMIAPWKDWNGLDAAQRAFEQQRLEDMAAELADAKAALAVLGVAEDV